MGELSFHDSDGYTDDLDLNWERLHTMDQPVIDEQLAKLAMASKWKKQSIQLASWSMILLENSSTINFNKQFTSM
jgi:hypothetical protein